MNVKKVWKIDINLWEKKNRCEETGVRNKCGKLELVKKRKKQHTNLWRNKSR